MNQWRGCGLVMKTEIKSVAGNITRIQIRGREIATVIYRNNKIFAVGGNQNACPVFLNQHAYHIVTTRWRNT